MMKKEKFTKQDLITFVMNLTPEAADKLIGNLPRLVAVLTQNENADGLNNILCDSEKR